MSGDVLDALAEFLLEGRTPAWLVEATGGPGRWRAADTPRLLIYAHQVRGRQRGLLDAVFPRCRDVVVTREGEAAWFALTDACFRAHPMRDFVLHANARGFPAQLRERAPAWLAELADFEWCELRADEAAEDVRDATPDAGPLRLASTVAVRRYRHDLDAWIDGGDPHADARPGEAAVVFWRSAALDACHAVARADDLAVIEHLERGAGLPARLHPARDALVVAGVILGARAVTA